MTFLLFNSALFLSVITVLTGDIVVKEAVEDAGAFVIDGVLVGIGIFEFAGAFVGSKTGDSVTGAVVCSGVSVGRTTGAFVTGAFVSSEALVGFSVGRFVGYSVGRFVGFSVGGFEGFAVCGFVGASVGGFVGASVGGFVGASVGGFVGASVGGFVGASVGGFVVTGAFVGGTCGAFEGVAVSAALSVAGAQPHLTANVGMKAQNEGSMKPSNPFSWKVSQSVTLPSETMPSNIVTSIPGPQTEHGGYPGLVGPS